MEQPSRRYGEAIDRCKKGLTNDPDHFLLTLWLGLALEMEGRYVEAIRELEKAVEISDGRVSLTRGALANALMSLAEDALGCPGFRVTGMAGTARFRAGSPDL